jgi:hypothetical protein
MPALPGGEVTLRVVYAVNPRLPQFSSAQLDRLLTTASRTAEEHLGVRVKLELTGIIPIHELFRGMPAPVWRELSHQIYDPGHDRSADDRLLQATYDALRAQSISPDLARKFLRAHLAPSQGSADLKALSSALVGMELRGMTRWRSLRAADGEPVISHEPYHQWMAWSALGYGMVPYDVVLTNQLVASLEYSGRSLHSMARGGVPIGTTFYSRGSTYGAYVFLSTFMFSSELQEVAELRADGRYSESEAATLAGAYLVHELGHLLLRLGHPYANEACVMHPVVMFQFRAWLANLDSARCQIGSEAEMRVGAVQLFYDKRLLH